jgi:hypothetical protein
VNGLHRNEKQIVGIQKKLLKTIQNRLKRDGIEEVKKAISTVHFQIPESCSTERTERPISFVLYFVDKMHKDTRMASFKLGK